MKIAAYVPDLMDRSRFANIGAEVQFVKTPLELASIADVDLVVVDLSRDGALQGAADLTNVKKIGFASHIDRERIDAAKIAGFDEVLPRSKFFSRIVELLA